MIMHDVRTILIYLCTMLVFALGAWKFGEIAYFLATHVTKGICG